jgi:hypothetical protein
MIKKIVLALGLLFSFVPAFAQNMCRKDLNTGEFYLNGQRGVYVCSYRIESNNGVLYGWWSNESTSDHKCGMPNDLIEYSYDETLKMYVNSGYRIKVLGENAFHLQAKDGKSYIYSRDGF